MCWCYTAVHGCSHPCCLHAPWKSICLDYFPEFMGSGVIPLTAHSTVRDGVKCRNWVRLRHNNFVKRRGARSLVFPTQLSRIWRFFVLLRCRSGLSWDTAKASGERPWPEKILSYSTKRKKNQNYSGKRPIQKCPVCAELQMAALFSTSFLHPKSDWLMLQKKRKEQRGTKQEYSF